MSFRKGLVTLAVGAMLMAGAASAKAGTIIVTFVGTVPTPNIITGPNTEFDYNATLAQGQAPTEVITGDYFTIYDFVGYTGTHTQPAGWTLTTANTGVTNPSVSPIDNPGIINLTWTYSGATINSTANLGLFTAVSTLSTVNQNGQYSMKDQAEIISGPNTGQFQDENQLAFTTVPAPAVPVPASAVSGMLLLAGLASWRLSAKLKQA